MISPPPLPDDKADTLLRQGAAAHRAGDLEEALRVFTAACNLAPDRTTAWNGRAAVLSDLGRDAEAANLLQEADATTGGALPVLANLAILQEKLGRYADAAETARRVLAGDAGHVAARLTLGLALLGLGQPDEAVREYRLLAEIAPGNPAVFLNLGESLMAAGAYAEALSAYETALALDAALTQALVGKGQALAMLREFAAADTLFEAVAQRDPRGSLACFERIAARSGTRLPFAWQARAVEIFLSRHWIGQQVCDWRERSSYLDELRRHAERLATSGAPARDESLAFQSLAAPLTIEQRRSLCDAVSAGIADAGLAPARRRGTRMPGPLRLGFLSTGFRNHPSAQLHWRHLALYDRRRFRIHAYSLIDDPSSPLRDSVAKSADTFRDLSRATPDEAGWRIARDGIDILVDLAGHQDNARPELLAARPAPLQVSYHGSPLCMGARLVDYRISDRIASPDDAEFTEAVAWLPYPHCMYNDAEPIARQPPDRRTWGLPEQGLVFCAFNNAFKIEPGVFGIWMTLLREFPASVLWLLDGGARMRDNLRREASACGIPGERLVFAPKVERAAHLARQACADLFLDTFICNAHTTAADALWAGLPVLTRAGDSMASRYAATQVIAAGLPELVVSTTADYLAQARRLAATPALLAELRRRLEAGRENSRLFATERRVGHLMRAFEMMWERHRRGEPPVSFDIPED